VRIRLQSQSKPIPARGCLSILAGATEATFLAVALLIPATACAQQSPPAASGARILLLPRKIVSGEHATLAVLDVSGRLTPGVNVIFSNGDKVTTDTTGRALFVAPLNLGVISASIEGRAGKVYSTILASADVSSATEVVESAPRVASVNDRFEIAGHGFCADADANHVTTAGVDALVLASSPAYLAILPPAELNPGPAQVQATCGQKVTAPFTVVFVGLELEASNAAMAPGERRTLTVRVRGSTAPINLEARNLAPDIADLVGGVTARAVSSGGAENLAKFELVGKARGSFVISIRLMAPLGPPRP
jgi:hypothetical protein